jgi:hypothetical protein
VPPVGLVLVPPVGLVPVGVPVPVVLVVVGDAFTLESLPPPPQDIRRGHIAVASKITSEALIVRMRGKVIVESSSVKYTKDSNNFTRIATRAAMYVLRDVWHAMRDQLLHYQVELTRCRPAAIPYHRTCGFCIRRLSRAGFAASMRNSRVGCAHLESWFTYASQFNGAQVCAFYSLKPPLFKLHFCPLLIQGVGSYPEWIALVCCNVGHLAQINVAQIP